MTAYEWAKSVYGDEADNMSESNIQSLYNQAHGNVSADSISNQDFRNDKETNANLYKLGSPLFGARKEFDKMQKESQERAAKVGKTDITSPEMRSDSNSIANFLHDKGILKTSSGLESHDSLTDLAEMRHKLKEAGVDVSKIDNSQIKEAFEKHFNAGQDELGNDVKTADSESQALTDENGNVIDEEGGSTPKITNSDGEVQEAQSSVNNIIEEVSDSISNGNKEDSEVVEEAIDQTKKTKKGRFALKSIFEAYNDGEIDESTRDYMIVNAISTYARNLGKDFANIAAAYTGGTIDNTREESLWDQRNKQLSEASTEQSIREDSNEARSIDENDLDWKAKKLGVDAKELDNETRKYNNMNLKDKRNMADAIISKYKVNGRIDFNNIPIGEKIKLAGIYNSLLSNGQVTDKDALVVQGFDWFDQAKEFFGF